MVFKAFHITYHISSQQTKEEAFTKPILFDLEVKAQREQESKITQIV